MKRYVLVFLCLTSMAFADIESNTFIGRVAIPGDDQQAGRIAWVIDSDEFPTATQRKPVHIRVGLEEGVTLSETLVGPREPAILVPMRSFSGDAQVVAPADAVSIVRWREGESAFWVRISAPTNTWLEDDGVVQAPSAENSVLMIMGLDAAGSRDHYESHYLDGKANLPATQQAGCDTGTEIVLDLEADLWILLSYVPSAYSGRRGNIRTRAPEHAIHVGPPLDLVIYGDFFIAATLTP